MKLKINHKFKHNFKLRLSIPVKEIGIALGLIEKPLRHKFWDFLTKER